MNIFHGSLWDNILQILRDPIFALIFTAFLTILASRVVRRVIKTILYLSALGVFIWLVTHNQSFANVCIAIVSAIFHILLVLIIVLAVICVVATLCVLIMFIISKPSPPRLRKLTSPWNILSVSQKAEGSYSPGRRREVQAALEAGYVDSEQAKVLLHEKGQRVSSLTQDFVGIFEYLVDDFDEDHWFKMIISLLHVYFSGLSMLMEPIRKIHQACNEEIMDLASILPVIFPGTDMQILEEMAQAKTFLPDKNEWQDLRDDMDVPIPYILLRLFCLRRDWKEVCTIVYKGYRYVTLLDECKEKLYDF